MKKFQKNSLLLPAVVVLSAAAWWLRRQLYAVAVDAKRLLVAGHPLEIALWAVVLAGAALVITAVSGKDGSQVYEDNFAASGPAALGHCLMGCTVLMMTLLHEVPMDGPVETLWKLLGYLSAPAMLWGGLCRLKGRKPFFGIHAGLCMYLLLYLISCYQLWSSNPQLQDYVFELLAAVALVLFSYQCAAFEAGIGSRRKQLATGLLAVLLCGAANFRAQVPALYAGGFVWALTDLCRLDPPPKQEEVENHDPS